MSKRVLAFKKICGSILTENKLDFDNYIHKCSFFSCYICHMVINNKTFYKNIFYSVNSVSYTHLDVYKRQELADARQTIYVRRKKEYMKEKVQKIEELSEQKKTTCIMR